MDEAERILQRIATSKNISRLQRTNQQPAASAYLALSACGHPNQDEAPLENEVGPKEFPSHLQGKRKPVGDSRTSAGVRYTALELFKSRQLITRSLVVFYCW